MLSYRFYIRDNQVETPAYVEAEEPIGWDGCSFTLQRSDQFDGLENVYSEDLTFYGVAGEILLDAFNNYGFDALLDFKIEFYCDGILNTTIENVINMLTYKRVGNETTVATEESSFGRKFKSRYETQINFNDELSIEGQPLTTLDPFDLKLHSKLIRTTATIKELGLEIDTDKNGHFPMLYTASSDMDGTTDVESTDFDDPNNSYFIGNDTPFDRTIDINVRIRLNSLAHITTAPSGVTTETYYSGGYTMFLQVTDEASPPNVIVSLTMAVIPATNSMVGLVDDFTYSNSIFIQPGFRIRIIYVDHHEATLPGPIIHRDNKYTYLSETEVDLKEDSKIIPSTSKAWYVYECFNRVCESITDQQNSFKSDFFGRVNSSPQTYLKNGCAAWEALTNGLNIRKMLDKDGNFFPFTTSFLNLFTSFNAIYNLGARIESNGSGGYYIRVEPKEYFYDNSGEIFTVSSPSEITTEVAVDKLYNDIQIGYEKWQIESINGIDEPNASHTYTIPLTNVKQRLEVGNGNGVTSPFIGGGFAIEITRRLQYADNPTTDWEYDNDNFIICVNKNTVNSDQYSNPPVAQDYLPGEVSERDENYISIQNLLSPSTAYNLRISPGNMILNWFKSLAPSILLKQDPNRVIKFQSGDGNYQMITQKMPDDCIIALNEIIIEDQDLTQYITKYSNLQLISLYTPTYISFDYPIDFGNFITIKEGSNKLIRVECDELTYFGFIKELKFSPNDGSANFKILLTGCFKGGFTSGFSDGFEIGTC